MPNMAEHTYRNNRSYSLSEMKMFKKISKAIRNVDEREGHSEATAAFIDTEFLDNSGRTVKALKSNSSWKKQRVNTICEKAARIMEDRYVITDAHDARNLTNHPTGSAYTASGTPSPIKYYRGSSSVSTNDSHN